LYLSLSLCLPSCCLLAYLPTCLPIYLSLCLCASQSNSITCSTSPSYRTCYITCSSHGANSHALHPNACNSHMIQRLGTLTHTDVCQGKTMPPTRIHQLWHGPLLHNPGPISATFHSSYSFNAPQTTSLPVSTSPLRPTHPTTQSSTLTSILRSTGVVFRHPSVMSCLGCHVPRSSWSSITRALNISMYLWTE
jgi:hypothetical protein